MYGLKRMTVFSRKVSFLKGSRLDLRSPAFVQKYNVLPPGSDGDSAKHGVHGANGMSRDSRFYGFFHYSIYNTGQ